MRPEQSQQRVDDMNSDSPIWILEPELTEKRDLSARKLLEVGQKAALIPETLSIREPLFTIRH